MSVEAPSAPADKVQSGNKSDDDTGSVSIPADKVQPNNKSDNDTGCMSMPEDKVQLRTSLTKLEVIPFQMTKYKMTT